jgi:FMN-dependent NADH-azoreductase
MNNILAIDSSVSGESSVSRQLVDETIAQLLRANPAATVTRRDLGRQPVPHLTTETVAGVRDTPTSASEHSARSLADELIAELRSADALVIGAPMYNFGVPTALRAWFDHIVRAGETFSYSDAGPQGLIVGVRAIVLESRGGFYSEGPAQATDFQEPYLRHLLSFIGITEVSFVRAERIGFGLEARQAAIEGAEAQIAEVLRSPAMVAA